MYNDLDNVYGEDGDWYVVFAPYVFIHVEKAIEFNAELYGNHLLMDYYRNHYPSEYLKLTVQEKGIEYARKYLGGLK